MEEILNDQLPDLPDLARLPGVRPVAADDWLRMDEVFARQMALRDRLLAERRDEVYRMAPEAEVAAAELLAEVLRITSRWPGYRREGDMVLRPDGVAVALDSAPPLVTAARLVQEDLCILKKPDGAAEHVLTGAVLCFPASWTLAEKFGHPLVRIHRPVAEYDDDLGRRVQRLFDSIRPGVTLCRGNLLPYEEARLHAPRPEAAPRDKPRDPAFLRSERQCLVRLPETAAVIFSIHSYVVRRAPG